MAAPIAHIFLALELLSDPLAEKNFDEKEFILGTSFPDIRYLNITDRDKTHYKKVTFKEVIDESNSFKAGIMLHSLVDNIREKYFQDNNIYEKIPKIKLISQALKFTEDKFLFPYINVNKISNYFDTISIEEKKFGISDEKIMLWRRFLKNYISNGLTKKILDDFFDLKQSQNFIQNIMKFYYKKEMLSVMNQIKSDEEVKKIILDFYFNKQLYLSSFLCN